LARVAGAMFVGTVHNFSVGRFFIGRAVWLVRRGQRIITLYI